MLNWQASSVFANPTLQAWPGKCDHSNLAPKIPHIKPHTAILYQWARSSKPDMSNQQTLLSNPDIAFPTQQALPRNSYTSILTKKILLSKPNQAIPTLKIWSTKADPPNQKKNIKKTAHLSHQRWHGKPTYWKWTNFILNQQNRIHKIQANPTN